DPAKKFSRLRRCGLPAVRPQRHQAGYDQITSMQLMRGCTRRPGGRAPGGTPASSPCLDPKHGTSTGLTSFPGPVHSVREALPNQHRTLMGTVIPPDLAEADDRHGRKTRLGKEVVIGGEVIRRGPTNR